MKMSTRLRLTPTLTVTSISRVLVTIVVPYPRSIRSVVGLKNEAFNRMFTLLRGSATNDSDNRAKLITSIGANMATPIKLLAVGNGSSYSNWKALPNFLFYFSSCR